MRVAEDDGVGLREARAQPPQPAVGGAAVVDDREHRPLDRDHLAGGERRAHLRIVGVAVDGEDRRPERLELVKDREGREVTGVHDEVRGGAPLERRFGDSPRPAGQMRVREDGDLHAAGRYPPLRYAARDPRP